MDEERFTLRLPTAAEERQAQAEATMRRHVRTAAARRAEEEVRRARLGRERAIRYGLWRFACNLARHRGAAMPPLPWILDKGWGFQPYPIRRYTPGA
jgi:hypothetical protein